MTCEKSPGWGRSSSRLPIVQWPGRTVEAPALRVAFGKSLRTRELENLPRPNQPFLSREKHRRAFLDILGWLWEVIAAPVLEAITGPVGQDPLRVWWCPTGPLVSLPLHAAGRHPVLLSEQRAAERRAQTVLSWTISSYVPTLAALAAPAASARRCRSAS